MYRAVAARAAVGEQLGPARRKYFNDPDEKVRLAALRASLEVPDHSDAHRLLEMARLDPNPLAQALAVRAFGPIANAEHVVALHDLFVTADEGLRQAIVDAWGQSGAAEAGGVSELIRVRRGRAGVAGDRAGWVLLKFPAEPRAKEVGTRALLRGMSDGLSRDRILAVMDAPLVEGEVLDTLRKLAKSNISR